MLPWVPRGALGQRRGLPRTAVRPKPRFPVWRGRELCGGYPLGISSRRFCQAIPVVPPRPVSAAATEYRSTECPARTLVKSASEPHSHGGCMEGKCRRVLVPPGHITLNLSGTRSLKKPGPGPMARTTCSGRTIVAIVHGTVRVGPYPRGHRAE